MRSRTTRASATVAESTSTIASTDLISAPHTADELQQSADLQLHGTTKDTMGTTVFVQEKDLCVLRVHCGDVNSRVLTVSISCTQVDAGDCRRWRYPSSPGE